MKKILVILMMFLSFSIFSQAEDYFPDRVKLGTTPTSNAIDNLITIDADGILNRSTVTLNNIGVGMFLPLAGGTLTGNLNIETSGNAEIKTLRISGADTRITSQSSMGQIGTFSNHALQLVSNSAARYEISENGNHDFKIGDALFGGNLTINGSFTNNNLRFTTSGSNAYIDNKTNGGDVYFRTLADDASQYAQILMRGSEKDVSLHFNTVAKLRTNVNGVDVFGDINATSFIGNGSQLTNINAVTLEGSNKDYFKNKIDSRISWLGVNQITEATSPSQIRNAPIVVDKVTNANAFSLGSGSIVTYSSSDFYNETNFIPNYNGVIHQFFYKTNTNDIHYRGGVHNDTWNPWVKLLHTGNFGKTQIDALNINATQLNGETKSEILSDAALTGVPEITRGSPILSLKATNTPTPNSHVSYFSFKNSLGTETAWMGYGSNTNSDFNIQNSYGRFTINGYLAYHAGNLAQVKATDNADAGTKGVAVGEIYTNTTTGILTERLSSNAPATGGLPANFYEEGTFTPTLVGGSYTFTSNDARYTRIGNQVTVSLNLTSINGTATASDSFQISGLTHPVTTGVTHVGNISTFSGSNKTNTSISPIKSIGSNNIQFAADRDNATILNTVNFTNGVIRLTITYMTNVYTP